MVRILVVVAVMGALGCAHGGGPPVHPSEPTLAGSIGNVRFDRSSVTGPLVSMARGADGNWRGVWACGPAGGMCPGEVLVGEHELQVTGRRFGLTLSSGAAAIHQAYVDVLFQRADGGPLPREVVVPLWLAFELAPSNRQTAWTKTAPSVPSSPGGWCLPVEGLGTVAVIVLPRRDVPVSYEVDVQQGCAFHFGEKIERMPSQPSERPDGAFAKTP